MNFLDTLRSSIYNPEFYKKTLSGWSLGTSFAYYVTLAALVSLVAMSAAAFWIVPFANGVLERVTASTLDVYPEDLVIAYKDGIFSSNVVEPYAIEVGTTTRELAGEELPKNLLVIDTKNDAGPSSFAGYNTLILITKNSVYTSDGDEGVSRLETEKFGDTVIDRATVGTWVYRASSFGGFLAPVFLIGFFLITFFAQMLSVVGFIFYAVFVWLFMYAALGNFTYRKAFQYTLHLSTLPIIAHMLMVVFAPEFAMPFLFEALFLLAMVANLIQMRETAI